MADDDDHPVEGGDENGAFAADAGAATGMAAAGAKAAFRPEDVVVADALAVGAGGVEGAA